MYEKLNHCPLCQSPQIANYLVVKDHAVSQESFSICKCSKCDFLFTNPRPDENNIQKYYDSKNYISHQDKTSNLTNFLYKIVRGITLKKKIKWLNENSSKKGRLLDFGCGTGYFLREAKSDGWEGVGFETNSQAASVAWKKHGLQVYQDKNLLQAVNKFDVITLFHVLEHVHDLKGTMDLLLSKLKKKGTLLVAVPNYSSYDSLLYKENWASLDVPRHLYHFTSQTMEVLTQEYGLKIKEIKPMVFDSYYVSILSDSYIKKSNNIIKSVINGYKSNKKAKKDNNYSSLLFILKKI